MSAVEPLRLSFKSYENVTIDRRHEISAIPADRQLPGRGVRCSVAKGREVLHGFSAALARAKNGQLERLGATRLQP
jgi:hypothetical protein